MNIQQNTCDEAEGAKESAAITGVIGKDSAQLDSTISDTSQALLSAGYNILGMVQERGKKRAGCAHREMRLRDLVTGQITIISESRGEQARGCHLDRAALLEHAKQFELRISDMPELVIINRFGRAECEGSGFRSAIELAVSLNIPVLVGVSSNYHDSWKEFHGGLADETGLSSVEIINWFESLQATKVTVLALDAGVDLGIENIG